MKYKEETWKIKKWKGTKRETINSVNKLVLRDTKGHFKSVADISLKNYGSGVYKVGIKKGKIITRKRIARKSLEWEMERKTRQKREIYRSSYVLNNIPVSVTAISKLNAVKANKQSWTTGFRINCFSRNKDVLVMLKPKMKDRLIKYIEKHLGYDKGEWWFDSYFGYEAPSLINGANSENNRYYVMIENMRGTIKNQESGDIRTL